MLVPGSNLLNLAARAINMQAPQVQPFTGRTKNAAGVFAPQYGPAAAVVGSVQPVSRTAYQALGLDLSRYYVVLYTSQRLRVIERDQSGDRVTYGGRQFEAQSDMDWSNQDGWSSYLCVEVGKQ